MFACERTDAPYSHPSSSVPSFRVPVFRLRRWYHALKYFARFDEFKIVIGSIMAKLATIIQFVSCEDEIDTNVDGSLGTILLSVAYVGVQT